MDIKEEIMVALKTAVNKPIPNEEKSFIVYDWMLERFPEEVNKIAKNMFNGNITVIPIKHERK